MLHETERILDGFKDARISRREAAMVLLGLAAALDHFASTVDGYDADRAMASCREAGLEPRRIDDRVYFDDPDGLELQVVSPFGSWPGPPPAP